MKTNVHSKLLGLVFVILGTTGVVSGAYGETLGVGIDLHDSLTVRSTNPIEIWRKMRPQDFVGAPTTWQTIV